MKIKLKKGAIEFLEEYAHKVHSKETWYYMPYWFKKGEDNVFETVSFENLPEHVKDMIKELRDREAKPDVQ